MHLVDPPPILSIVGMLTGNISLSRCIGGDWVEIIIISVCFTGE